MRISGVGAGVAGLALVFVAASDAAQAGSGNFFDQLFGNHRRQAAPARPRGPVFGKDWWQGNDLYGGGQIIGGTPANSKVSSKTARRVPADNPDPEVGTDNFGMGNLVYAPDRVVSLATPPLKAARPDGAVEGAVYDAIEDKASALRVAPDAREAMIAQYSGNGFKPLWVSDGKLQPRAISLLKLLSSAGEDGLQAANYLPAELADYGAAESFTAADTAAAARLDLQLTAAALKYAHDISGGQFTPRKLSQYNDITPDWVPAARAIKVLAYSPFPDAYLKALAPQLPAYAAMKAALAEANKSGEADKVFTPIPGGKKIRLGQSDPRVAAVRERLADLLNMPDLNDGTTVLDSDLSDALKQFQNGAGIKQTGTLDPATVAKLNSNNAAADRKRLIFNMERLRWLPKQLGEKYVLVNQAGFQVQVMDHGQQVWQSRVIVGKPMTQTAVFNNNIQTVVFNPYWGVPASIIAKEYLAKLQRDPSYLDKLGFEVTTLQGTQIASADVDWWSYTGKIPYNVQQPPGGKNALGELKFLFPNAHNIYMHDTPNRELFDENVRAFSHGCVRVQNPRDYATVLLGWDRSKVDDLVESGQTRTVKLPAPVPIHIAYFTAWPDQSGKMHYYGDIYGRDQAMDGALSTVTLAQR